MSAETGPGGRLADDILRFARALRAAGLPVGTDNAIDALDAVRVAGLGRRDDFYWALHALFVRRREQRETFDRIFRLFWRDARPPERPPVLAATDERPRPGVGREPDATGPDDDGSPERDDADATMTFSERDALRAMDFDDMTADEIERAKRIVARMRLDLDHVPTRRLAPAPDGDRIDRRRTLRDMTRHPAGPVPLRRARQDSRPPALVLLCDVSGSMAGYSRMLAHFAHALTNDRRRVHTFAFGTRLTDITRDLRHRDVDKALALVARRVDDWSGGTRIGACLRRFNRFWGRRILGQGAVAILVTDGLDRDADGGLGREMALLRRSCRKLVWLNPLLRWPGFEPRSWGVRTMLPHVDAFRTCHNLKSLEELADALVGPDSIADREMEAWLKAA